MIPIKYRPRVKRDGEGRVKRNFREPSDELLQAFKEYMEDSYAVTLSRLDSNNYEKDADYRYMLAQDHLEEIEVSYEQANSLLVLDQDEEKSDKWRQQVGVFLSAAYNQSEQEVITYDLELETPLSYLGYKLSSDKTLILESDTYVGTGYKSEGTVINRAHSAVIGSKSSGLNINLSEAETLASNGDVFLNFGKTERLAERDLYDGSDVSEVVANFGEASRIDNPIVNRVHKYIKNNGLLLYSGVVIYPGGKNDEKIESYFNHLAENFSGDLNSVKEFLKERKPNPQAEIKKEIDKMIEAAK